MRTGTADLPLHYGRAPKWLFGRMTKLAKAIVELVILDAGPTGFFERTDPDFRPEWARKGTDLWSGNCYKSFGYASQQTVVTFEGGLSERGV